MIVGLVDLSQLKAIPRGLGLPPKSKIPLADLMN